MATYGRPNTLPWNDFGNVPSGQLRACVFNAASQHLWAYEFKAFVGKHTNTDPDNVTFRMVCYNTDAAKDPTSRRGYSSQITVSTVMNDISQGAVHTAAVEVSTGPANTGIPLSAGSRYALGFLGTVGAVGHAMEQAADITADNEKFYNRGGLSQPPPDPIGSFTSSNEGHLVIWLECEENEKPLVPINRVPSGTINETVPSMEGDFDDVNFDRGDFLNQSHIQVRRQSDGLIFWDSVETAGPIQVSASRVIRTYGGTTLVRGTTYEWRVRVSDYFSTWGDWSSWLAFTPANLGFVTLDAAPTGKQESVTPDFQGRWNHQSAANMTRAQVRILNGSGTVLQTGADFDIADVASSAPPGTLFTIPWASAGLSALAWGGSYQYQIRGKDATLYSDWSAARTFNTNAAPNIPSNLNPSNSQIISAATYGANLPLLTAIASDVDDTSASGLVVKVRIRSSPELNNPSFAVNTSSWAADGVSAGITQTLTRDTGVFDSTPAAGKIGITANTAGVGAIVNYLHGEFVAVEAGESHTQSMAVRTTNANITPLQYVRWYDASQVLLSTSTEADWTPTVNTWTTRNFVLTAPASAKWMKHGVQAFCDTAGPIGDVHFDTLSPGSSIRRIRAMTLSGSTWQYQTVAEDLPDFDFYEWNAYSFDGTLYSGETTVEASAARSATATFTYAQGPTVTIDAPTENAVITTASLLVDWTTTDQQKFRVKVFSDGTQTVIYDSGLITSTVTSHTIPSGYLRNNTAYDIVVEVENSVPLGGTSATRNISVAYTPPASIQNFQAIPAKIGTDIWESVIRLTWDQTEIATSGWQEYTIRRKAASGVDSASIILARVTSPSQTTYIDYAPASGITYTYTMTQTTITGVDSLESAEASAGTMVTLGGVVLCDVKDPATLRTTLRHTAVRDYNREIVEAVYQPLSGAAPTTVRARTHVPEAVFDVQLVDDVAATASIRRAELETLDLSGGTLCYRDNHGRKWFVTLPELSIKDQLPNWFEGSIKLRTERFVEGVI